MADIEVSELNVPSELPWVCWNPMSPFRKVLSLPEVKNTQIDLLKPTGYVMHQQFNIQQLYALPTLYLCVLYLSENKQRLVPLTS